MSFRHLLGAAAITLCACASASSPTTTPAPAAAKLPANLEVPPGNARRLTALAKGAQIYACTPKADGSGAHEWVFVAPQADLTDENGAPLGTHSAGPTWQLTDGSKAVGAVKEKAPAAGTIPWLLLSVKSSEGPGKLAGATFIQRVDTLGGATPADGCDAAHAGEKREVAYTATYHFYGQ